MNVEQLFPQLHGLLPVFRWLGKADPFIWRQCTPAEALRAKGSGVAAASSDNQLGACMITLREDLPTPPAPLLAQVTGMLGHWSRDFYGTLWADSLGRFLAEGPKTLTPSVEQCEALRNVAIGLYPQDYEQPFPVLFVVIPDAYRKMRLKATGWPQFPRGALIHKRRRSGHLSVSVAFDPIPGTVSYDPERFTIGAPWEVHKWFPPEAPRTIEDILREMEQRTHATTAIGPVPTDWDDKCATECQRLAINMCLWAVHAGLNRDEIHVPMPPQKGSQRPPRGRSGRAAWEARQKADREKLRRKLLAKIMASPSLVLNYRFARTVAVRNERGELVRPDQVTGDGRPRAVHWRRGHWRRQRHGPKLREVKRVFIAPVLVNGARYAGDVAGLETNYKVESHG